MNRITVTGFRWALEEAGLPYEVSLIDFGDLDSPAYRRKQPVWMVPAFEANGRDYLFDRFTAADILMATVLRLIRHTDLVASFPRGQRLS